MIQRQLTKIIRNKQRDGFVNVIYGPRRVGKTVLLNQITKNAPVDKLRFFNGDSLDMVALLSKSTETMVKRQMEKFEYIVIDEAQKIPNIGLTLKILIDMFPKKKVYVSGSSSLGLSKGIKEPLTGRHQTYKLYPLSETEIHQETTFPGANIFDDRLLFGGYPYVWTLNDHEEKKRYLSSVVSDYLFRDVLDLSYLDQPDNLNKLAVLLAFQIGNEVSLNELSNKLGVDVKTVRRYINLLKQSFVIMEVGAFAQNLRSEVAKSKKYYFWDLGVRNALINQFHGLQVRPDVGGMWENYLVLERVKKIHYSQQLVNCFFWRTYTNKEVDWVEEVDGKISGFEFKWGNKKPAAPKEWANKRPKPSYKVIDRENYLDFVT